MGKRAPDEALRYTPAQQPLEAFGHALEHGSIVKTRTDIGNHRTARFGKPVGHLLSTAGEHVLLGEFFVIHPARSTAHHHVVQQAGPHGPI